MTTCPKCRREHRGPRDLKIIRENADAMLVRSCFMDPEEAAGLLRVQMMCGALELFGYCADCLNHEAAAFIAQAHGADARYVATVSAPEAAAPMPEALPKVSCVVIPFGKRNTR